MDRIAQITISFVRAALSGEPCTLSLDESEWKDVFSFAVQHGVDALAFDGVQISYSVDSQVVAPLNAPSNKQLRYDWFGSGLRAEVDHENHWRIIASLASLYRSAGLKMLLLKGYGLSMNYPVPEHRPAGDIDVYLFGRGGEADELVRKETGVLPKQNEDKHSTFRFKGITVENHAFFVSTSVHPALERLEAVLEREALQSAPISFPEDKGGTLDVLLPSSLFNALFVPFHCAGHFVHGEASLRQLCDWACFVRHQGKDVDWEFVRKEVEAAGFDKFYCCLNGIVEQYLGVSSNMLPPWPRYPELQERVFDEILNKGQAKELSVFGKVRRFLSSAWKYRLVYRDNMAATFFRLAKSYILVNNSSGRSIWER